MRARDSLSTGTCIGKDPDAAGEPVLAPYQRLFRNWRSHTRLRGLARILLPPFAGLLLAFNFGCPGTAHVSPGEPRITSFTAMPSVVRAGSSTTLRWDASADAFRILWNDENGLFTWVDLHHSVREWQIQNLRADTRFTLGALKSGIASATQGLDVRVSPAIVRLTALPAAVTSGQSTTITYRVLGSPTRLVMQPGSHELPVAGATDRYWTTPPLTGTTTFTLTASNGAGSDAVQLTVPLDGTAQPPQIQSFTANPATIEPGGSTTLTWSILGQVDRLVLDPGNVPISPAGNHRVDHVVAGGNTFTLTASNAAGASSATLTVNLDNSAATLRISPGSATTTVGVPVSLSAIVTGLSDPSVTWTSTPAEGATWSIGAGGALAWRFSRAGTYVIRATSVERPSLWAEATITVLPEVVAVSLSPSSTILKQFAAQTFTATVSGTPDPRVTWSASGGGTLTPGPDRLATYLAGEIPGPYQVTAASLAGGTPATATVTIPDQLSNIQFFSLTYQAFSLSRSQLPAAGEARRFAATITGTSPGGAASFNGGWDWEIPAGAGTARTVGYSCVQPAGASCSSMHTIEWLIPAGIPVGTYTLRLRPWINPAYDLTLTLTVNP
jgi:hypothetical protein